MRIFLSIFLSLFSFSIAVAQFEAANLFPVKINHKWGLIDANGTLVMEPKYDLFGEKFGGRQMVGNSFSEPFVTVQIDNQLGLVNMRGEEILPPVFDELIEAFSDSIFTVKKDGNILVVNQKGETIFDGKYEAVIPIPRNSDYFIVIENGLFGLIKKGKGYVIPNQYAYLGNNKNGQSFLNFSTLESYQEEKIGLISFDNKVIFPPEFESIKIITPNHFLTKKEFFEMRDANQKVLISQKEEWTKVKIISKSFISFYSSFQKKGSIYSTKSNSYIQTKTAFDEFEKFNKHFLLGKKEGKYGLIDTLGNEVIPPHFSLIQELEGDSLFRVKKIQWGVYKSKEGLLTDLIYETIFPYNNTFAQVKIGENTGLINRKGKEVTPVQFEYFQFQDEFVKGFQGIKMYYYERDSINQLKLLEIYPEVYNLRIGYDDPMDALPNVNPFAGGGGRGAFRRTPRRVKKTPDYSQITNSDVEWFQDWGLWGLRKKSTQEIIIKPQYESTRRLPFTDLTIVYSYDEKIDANALLELFTINPKKGAFGIAFYSHQQEKFVTDFEFMGIRIEDFEYDLPYASCLDKNGKFVLVSKKGKVLNKNRTFDFIGDFYEGKARICVNGIPKGIKKQEETGYKISSTTDFQHSFKVRYNRFLTAPSSDLFWIGGTWGFIDTLGQIVVPPTFEYVNDFEENTAICKKENWGAINGENKPILDFDYKSIDREQGLLKAGVPNRRPVFYNALGNAVVDWGYETFKEFSEGYCVVKKNGKWGLVNEKGEEVLECKYITINSFSEGKASIEDEAGWYFVDSTLQVVLDFRATDYLGFGNFSNGLCWYKIKRNDKFFYGFIDKNGDTKINPVFTKAFDFQFFNADS